MNMANLIQLTSADGFNFPAYETTAAEIARKPKCPVLAHFAKCLD
jgi:hypothetical protein